MHCHFSMSDKVLEQSESSPHVASTSDSSMSDVSQASWSLTGDVAGCKDSKSSADAVNVDIFHSSHNKRKIFDCEHDDFEGRFSKIQRKKHLQSLGGKTNLNNNCSAYVDAGGGDAGGGNDGDEGGNGSGDEQMDWVEDVSGNTHSSCDEASHANSEVSTLLPLDQRLKSKEEQGQLLKISMEKIRDVDDPEIYLRRSVLIHNAVKKLQKDAMVNFRCHSIASISFFQGNMAHQNEGINRVEFEGHNINDHKQVHNEHESSISYKHSKPPVHEDLAMSVDEYEAQSNTTRDFHSSSSVSPEFQAFQQEAGDLSAVNHFNQGVEVHDTSSTARTVKQSSVHVFTSQPCGLQYRNPTEDSCEVTESPNSTSILDSVVYHSLITSLES